MFVVNYVVLIACHSMLRAMNNKFVHSTLKIAFYRANYNCLKSDIIRSTLVNVDQFADAWSLLFCVQSLKC